MINVAEYFGLVDVLAPIGFILEGHQVYDYTNEMIVSLLDSPYEVIVIYDIYANYSKKVICDCSFDEKYYKQNYEWTGYLLKQLSLTKLVFLVRSADKDYYTSLCSFHIKATGECIKSLD